MAVTEADRSDAVPFLCRRVKALLGQTSATHPNKRIMIALSGVPGSGKTTIASAVLRALPDYGIRNAQVVPMDGFHYPKSVLATFSDPVDALRRRGAPFTFDADALIALLAQLREMPVTTEAEPETILRAPSFDHAVHDPVPDDIAISSRTRLVIVEGNYTLLDMAPWCQIAPLVDDKWFVDVPADTAKERLVRRHLQAGIETSPAAAAHRVEANDMPNGGLVRAHLIEPHVRILH